MSASIWLALRLIVTFRVSRRRREITRICVSVCVSVPRRMTTLLHGPGCNSEEWYKVPPSCPLLDGFANGARVSLLWQHSPNAKCRRVLYVWLLLLSLLCKILSSRHKILSRVFKILLRLSWQNEDTFWRYNFQDNVHSNSLIMPHMHN